MLMGAALLLAGCQSRSRQESPDITGQGQPELEQPGNEDGDVLPDAGLILEGLEDRSGIFDIKPTGMAAKPGLPATDGQQQGRVPSRIGTTPEKELLTAEFTTYYGSNPSRSGNIEHAASLLNGFVIAPGEVFSCSEAIGPVTEENGYLPAGTYVQGKVQEGIGGGVCQISSTLYNAALYAGLTVVERSAHSMVVSYVDPGRDAAIAEGFKDLKIRNDYKYPVVLEASAKDGALSIAIHTAEEDTGVEVTLESVILSETEPGEAIVTVDKSKPKDYYKVTQKAHTGYVAELYRIVSRNGVEILKEKVNTSTYDAVPEYVTVGGKEEETEE